MLPELVGEYVDARSERDYEMQKFAAEERMKRFDAAEVELRRVWDAVGTERMARGLYGRGVRGFEVAERVKRVMGGG